MKKLYTKLSECELNILRNYAQSSGVKTYRRAIEQLIEEDSVSVLCLVSVIEKNLRKTAVNFNQIKLYIQSRDPDLTKEVMGILHPAIRFLSGFTSSILRNIQRGSGYRFEVQIRLNDDTKEALKQLKKAGSFRTYDALLRFMLTTHFEKIDFDKLDSYFSSIKKIGHLFNKVAHLYNLSHYVDLTELRQTIPEFQSTIDGIIELIGD